MNLVQQILLFFLNSFGPASLMNLLIFLHQNHQHPLLSETLMIKPCGRTSCVSNVLGDEDERKQP